ncbi:MAG: Fructose-bisphosphate aldolase class II, partial [uncultured Acetobacteraceae bacterium]
GLHQPAPVAGPRRRARLRRAGLQHQQHGAAPRHHGGCGAHRRAGDPPGEPRRARLRRRPHAPPHGGGGGGDASGHPRVPPSRPRGPARHLPVRHPARLHQRDDGRLARGRRQDARELRLQRRGDGQGHRDGALRRRFGGGRVGLPRLAGNRPQRGRGRARRGGRAVARPTPHRPGPGARLRFADRRGRAGGRHRDQPRRLQVQPRADRRHPRHGRGPRHPRAPAEHALGDARLVLRAAGTAGRLQRPRRRHAADLGRAGRGDPGRHQARRAEGEHRHGLPHRHGRPVPQGGEREARRVRPARLPEARHRRAGRALRPALRGVRHGGAGSAPAPAAAGRDGQALRQGRARSGDRRRYPRQGRL